MEADTYDALIGLHKKGHEDWSDILREGELAKIYRYVLSPIERTITDLRIDGYVNGEIAIKLHMKLETVKRYTYEIKYKYRNGLDSRISDHPAIRKQKGFIVRTKRRY